MRAKQTAANDEVTIADSTHGIAFLGTPHRGSNEAKWGEIGRKIFSLVGKTNETLLKDLNHQSDRLVRIGQDFPRWLRQQLDKNGEKVSVICFFEAQDTKSTGGQARII